MIRRGEAALHICETRKGNVMKYYQTANSYCRRTFGSKVYKLALSAAETCPNRDGTVGYGGCTFCSAGGSGDFAAHAGQSIEAQIREAREILGDKGRGLPNIAYFQSFTGTHGDLKKLEEIYTGAAAQPGIVGLSIATRPDCLGEDALAMLRRLSGKTVLWVELGLQTIHETTAKRINRCYPLEVYDRALENLAPLGIHVITHLILGLPGESREQMLESVRYVGQRSPGIKLQLLHVLRGTALAESYAQGEFEALSLPEYCGIVADALELLPESTVVHRITGDGAKRDLIAPLWSGDKKRVLAELNRTLSARGIAPIS